VDASYPNLNLQAFSGAFNHIIKSSLVGGVCPGVMWRWHHLLMKTEMCVKAFFPFQMKEQCLTALFFKENNLEICSFTV